MSKANALALFAVLALAFSGHGCGPPADPKMIHVAITGKCSGQQPSGDETDPFRRITDALDEAKARLDGNPNLGTVTVIVHEGVYFGDIIPGAGICEPNNLAGAKEQLPLVIDRSNVHLKGLTKTNQDGWPDDSNPKATTKIVATQDLNREGEVVILVTLSPKGAVSNVAIEGLVVEGPGCDVACKVCQPCRGVGIFVDRAAHFTVRGNQLKKFGGGLRTRGASGDIAGNESRDNKAAGLVASGGSKTHPARVTFLSNRVIGNEIGILLVATGTYKIDVLGSAPLLKAWFELPADANEVPDELTASVLHNRFESNSLAGLRVFATGQRPTTYDPGDGRAGISTRLELTTNGNSFTGDREYAISLDAGFPQRPVEGNQDDVEPSDPWFYQTHFNANFGVDSFDNKGLARAFFGFVRLQVALKQASPVTFGPLERSTFLVTYPGNSLDGYHYWHFERDLTPTIHGNPVNILLSNQLLVNGNKVAYGQKP